MMERLLSSYPCMVGEAGDAVGHACTDHQNLGKPRQRRATSPYSTPPSSQCEFPSHMLDFYSLHMKHNSSALLEASHPILHHIHMNIISIMGKDE